MSRISDLEGEISYCNEQIGICQEDIREMQEYITRVTGKRNELNTNVYDPESIYDLSCGSEWRGELEKSGVEKQSSTANGIMTGINGCNALISSIESAISRAQEMISGYRDRISSCQSEIAAIQEEERRQREREEQDGQAS